MGHMVVYSAVGQGRRCRRLRCFHLITKREAANSITTRLDSPEPRLSPLPLHTVICSGLAPGSGSEREGGIKGGD